MNIIFHTKYLINLLNTIIFKYSGEWYVGIGTILSKILKLINIQIIKFCFKILLNLLVSIQYNNIYR